MSLTDDRPVTVDPVTSTSEIRRGSDDQWWWMAFVTVIAMVALALSIVSFALYSSKDSGGDSGTGGTAATPAATLSIGAKEFAFSPSRWTAKAASDVSVTLTNGGAVDHEWTVLKAGTKITKEADFNDSLVAVKVGPATAGASATGSVNLAAGVYQVICTIKGHFDAGMAGTLTVN